MITIIFSLVLNHVSYMILPDILAEIAKNASRTFLAPHLVPNKPDKTDDDVDAEYVVADQLMRRSHHGTAIV